VSLDFRIQLTFWGVRGSVATPDPANLGYGGNTSCIEIRTREGERVIIDAGTGIRNLGRQWIGDANLFLTHFHWDHIQGIPFFAPLFRAGNKVRFHSFPSEDQIRERLERQMSSPFFTLDFSAAAAAREFLQVESAGVRYGDLSVTPFPLNHPQGAYGYRLEAHGAALVIATDVEHGHLKLDKLLRERSEGADVLVYDAQYTAAEYASRQGWGHSTCVEAARVASDARVKRLVLFHHDPTHEDAKIDQIVKETSASFESTSAAREHCTITL
jgi:phosphoribosyl 1,2-cyclic phosphodiesterase